MPKGCTSSVYERIRLIPELTSLPEMLSRILMMLQDESFTALDLAADIDRHPSLAGQILRLINSREYGLERGVTSIPDAVILLGFDEIERLALAVSVANVFGRDKGCVKTLSSLWRHSLAAALAAQVMEQQNRRHAPSLLGAHVGAMLHDIGKAAVIQHMPEERFRIQCLVDNGVPVQEAEREVLDGATHADIGAWLAESWELPKPIVESIRRHHAPEDVHDDEPMIYAAHVANCLVKGHGLGAALGDAQETVHPAAASAVGLSPGLENKVAFALDRCRCLMGAVSRGDMFNTWPEGV